MYRTGMILRMYRLTPGVCIMQLFIFCKDDSEMLRLSKKLSNFPMMLYRETSQLQAHTPKRPYDVSLGQNRYVRLPYNSIKHVILPNWDENSFESKLKSLGCKKHKQKLKYCIIITQLKTAWTQKILTSLTSLIFKSHMYRV